jgi:hypothetical protein
MTILDRLVVGGEPPGSGGIEHLYREVGIPATELILPSPPTPEEFGRWPAAAPKYGLELLGPPLPE